MPKAWDSGSSFVFESVSLRFPAEVAAVALLSAASVIPSPLVSATCAGGGLVCLASSIWGDRTSTPSWRWAGLAAIALVLISRVSTVGPFAGSFDDAGPLWIVLVVASLSTAILLGDRPGPRMAAIVIGLTAVAVPTLWMTAAEWDQPFGTDVYLIHQAGGAALISGENPYGPAVRVPSGSPHVPEGTVVEGYAYPPVVLTTYAALAALADPRLVSLIAWIVVLSWIASRAMNSRTASGSDRAFGVFLLLVATPVWPVIWFASWTEPLSLVLLLGAGWFWRRSRIFSAVLLGLALASKQYFLFLAPIVLLQRGEGKVQRAVAAFGTTALTMLPPLLVDLSGYVQATVFNLADIGFRPDSQSLSGMLAIWEIEALLPPALWIGLGLAFSAMVASRARGPHTFMKVAALALGFVFLTGQAFPNYWFLVMGMVAIGVCLTPTEVRSVEAPQSLGSG